MDSIVWIGILLLLTAFISMCNAALSLLNKTALTKAEDKSYYKKLERLVHQHTFYSTAIQWAQILVIFILMIYGIHAYHPGLSAWIIHSFHLQVPWAHLLANILLILIFSYLVFWLGKMIPQQMVLTKEETFATRFINPILFISHMLYPFTWLANQCLHLIYKLFSIQPLEEEKVSEEEIRMMINAGSENGDIDVPQKEWIENVFELDDTPIEEICTHRSETILLYLEDSIEDWQQVIQENRHTFYPICGEDDDDIIGVLDTRDYFRLEEPFTQDKILKNATDTPFFVSENTKASALLHDMKNQRNYFAIVLDEYGGMSGIITLHDIIETVLGEMNEPEDDIEPAEIQQINEDQWWIYGSALIEDVEKELHIKIPNDDYETFSGYVLDCLGRIPDDGVQFEVKTHDLLVSVKEMKNHRVGLTLVQKRKEETISYE